MKSATSLLSHDCQSLIVKTHTQIIDVINVLHILITRIPVDNDRPHCNRKQQ